MSFISLQINTGTDESPDWQQAVLKEDTSISIEESSVVWDQDAGGGAFSYEFELPVEENMHIIGTACEMRGKSIYKQLYGKKFRLYGGGLCLFYGVVRMDDEIEIEQDEDGITDMHTIGISLESDNYEWEDLLDGVSARDVQLAETVTKVCTYAGKTDDDGKPLQYSVSQLADADSDRNIFIGYCIPSYLRTLVTVTGTRSNDADKKGHGSFDPIHDYINTGFYIPKVLLTCNGYSRSKTPETNITLPYPQKTYCNATICYQHYVYSNEKWDAKRGYGIGKYDRVNSAPCFYVLYWMDLLFEDLNVSVRRNVLKDYEDIKRLAFFHTDCHYEEVEQTGKGESYSLYTLKKQTFKDTIPDSSIDEEDRYDRIVAGVRFGNISETTIWPLDDADGVKRIDYRLTDVICQDLTKEDDDDDGHITFKYMPLLEAYATADNFPDEDAKTILDEIGHAFGARYVYDAEDKSLEIVLVKDILQQDDCTTLECDIHKVTKSENHVTGFRLKYSATEDAESNAITQQEELTGVKQGTEGSDTTYSYNNYTNVAMLDPDSDEGFGYAGLMNRISAYDKTCYLHPKTGNAFRIKVDGDSNGGETMYPSLFEVGQFQKAEWGDCSKDKSNADFVEEVVIGFTPIVENDTNSKEEKLHNPDKQDQKAYGVGQSLAILVDGEIYSYTAVDTKNDTETKEGEFITQAVTYEMPLTTYEAYPTKYASEHNQEYRKQTITPIVNVELRMSGIEMWDLGNPEEPTNTNDSGFMLGIMRGSGGDAHTELYGQGYDGESDHSMWSTIPGTAPTFSADSIDQYGNHYDYNGVETSGGVVYNGKNLVTYYVTASSTGKVIIVEAEEGDTVSAGDKFMFVHYADTASDVISGKKVQTDGIITKIYVSVQDTVNPGDPLFTIDEGESTEVTTKENGLGYEIKDCLSLRLRAEKLNPGYNEDIKSSPASFAKNDYGKIPYDGYTYSGDGTTVTFSNGTTVPNTKYFPIDAECAKRGLADKFYDEYAHWVLNRRIANITCTMELAELINIDMTKRYRIGEYVGFIKSLSYTLDNETGLSPVEIEFYYL